MFVKKIIQRDIYTGYVRYGPDRAQGNDEPIIDRQTAGRVKLDLKNRLSGKRPMGQYLLSGILRCGECGSPMVHHSVTIRRRDGRGCFITTLVPVYRRANDTSRAANAVRLVTLRWNTWMPKLILSVQEIAGDADVLLADTNNSNRSRVNSELPVLEAQLTAIERKLKRWYDAYEEGILT